MGGLITAAVGSMKIIHLQRENKLIKKEKEAGILPLPFTWQVQPIFYSMV